MKHSLKVDHDVYQALLALQRPRETFNELIKRLLLVEKHVRHTVPYLTSGTITVPGGVDFDNR